MALEIDTSPDNINQNQMTSNRINNHIIVDQNEQLNFAAENYNTWLPALKNGEPILKNIKLSLHALFE